MADITVDEIKSKFQQLQDKTQKLKEEKISLESQLTTLKSQYDEQLAVLLKETGASTLEEAIQVCKSKQEELATIKESLSTTIDEYLQTINESTTEV